ncbi:hypothetical protein RB195_009578 [Necator americanus]|uniref:Uncharacterized protein n=1 Tax=Necator americanus TaxID=51031 RepID=A0ABR1CTY0_NECAM
MCSVEQLLTGIVESKRHEPRTVTQGVVLEAARWGVAGPTSISTAVSTAPLRVQPLVQLSVLHVVLTRLYETYEWGTKHHSLDDGTKYTFRLMSSKSAHLEKLLSQLSKASSRRK